MKLVQNVVKRKYRFRLTLRDGTVTYQTVTAESVDAARLLVTAEDDLDRIEVASWADTGKEN